jgi:xylulokinase
VALLAAVGAGVFSSVEEACRYTIILTDQVRPVPANKAAYERFYALYDSLYPVLKDRFREVSRLVRQDS